MSHRISRRATFRLATTLLACCTGLSAQAQSTWPTAKPITLIVPFSAGGNVDVTARQVGQRLSERLKQRVIIENLGEPVALLASKRRSSQRPTATPWCSVPTARWRLPSWSIQRRSGTTV